MIRKLLISSFIFIIFHNGYAQSVGNNELIDSTAIFDLSVSSKGILLPSLTMNQVNQITSPTNGLMIFRNNYDSGFYYYDQQWLRLGGQSWDDLPTKIFTSYNIGIGTNIPLTKLHIASGSPINMSNCGYMCIDSVNKKLAFDTEGIQAFKNALPDLLSFNSTTLSLSDITFINKIGNLSNIPFGINKPLQVGKSSDNTYLVFSSQKVRSIGGNLLLQNNGGLVRFGGTVRFGRSVTLDKKNVTTNNVNPYILDVENRAFVEVTNTGAVAFDLYIGDGVRPGQILVISCNAIAMNCIDNPAVSNMDLSGDLLLKFNDTLTLIWRNNTWYELSHSIN